MQPSPRSAPVQEAGSFAGRSPRTHWSRSVTAAYRPPRRHVSRRLLLTLLTAHIASSVGLLGDSAGFLAVSLRAAHLTDAGARLEHMEVLRMFAQVFGIPLSFATLLTGIALGLVTRWGVLRYPWVVAKLLLIVSVMAVGGIMIGPALHAGLALDADTTGSLSIAAAYDVVALAVATGLGVFKPGRPFRAP